MRYSLQVCPTLSVPVSEHMAQYGYEVFSGTYAVFLSVPQGKLDEALNALSAKFSGFKLSDFRELT